MISEPFAKRMATLPYKTTEERKTYRAACSEIENEFKMALFNDHHVGGEKAELLYQLCYQERHSDGLSGVECMFSDFAVLIKGAK